HQWEAIKQSDLASRLKEIKVLILIIPDEVDKLFLLKKLNVLVIIPNTKFCRIPKVVN
ncbi:11283_t:CDS:1, partial [Racocetra persica]